MYQRVARALVVASLSSSLGCGSGASGGGDSTGQGGSSGATGGSGGGASSQGGQSGSGPVVGNGGAPGSGGRGGGGGAAPGGTGGTAQGGSGGAGGMAQGGSAQGGSGGAGGTNQARDATASSDGAVARDAGADLRTGDVPPAAANFSFFVISMRTLQMFSGNPAGFGGDLTFGQATGLAGADEMCRRAAELGSPGAGQKQWRAFLSVLRGPDGNPVHARDRIGSGPWYDRNGRLLALNLTDLFAGARPMGDPQLVADMTNERGEPNHYVGANGRQSAVVDNHDTLTGSDNMGRLRATNAVDTCNDWTSATAAGRPYCGHSWPRSATSGLNWASDHQVPGCAPGFDKTLGGTGAGACVGCGGGYGGFYCFALP